MMSKYDVIYLTGAPASGKTTLTDYLKQIDPSLIVFEYGKALTNLISKKNIEVKTQEDIRRYSSNIITEEDVKIVDNQLIEIINENRRKRNIIIDSHPVTKEIYGFRITAFSLDKLKKVSPSKIFVLFANPEITINRIQKESKGRPIINQFEANMHTNLQASVGVMYAIYLGVPIYYLDSNKNIEILASEIISRI